MLVVDLLVNNRNSASVKRYNETTDTWDLQTVTTDTTSNLTVNGVVRRSWNEPWWVFDAGKPVVLEALRTRTLRKLYYLFNFIFFSVRILTRVLLLIAGPLI